MSSNGGSLRRSAIPQPTYDFLGNNNGQSPPPQQQQSALRQTLRQSSRPPNGMMAIADNEDIRAQLKSARYEIESLRADKKEAEVRHAAELRNVQTRAEKDFKMAQASETNKRATHTRAEKLALELKEVQDRAANAQRDLEKQLRLAQDRNKELDDDVGEARAELEGSQRQWSHRLQELEKKHSALQRTLRDIQRELDIKTSNLEVVQTKLKSKDTEIGSLEAEILQLRASGGDAEELSTIRTQLTDQVEHIRKLEVTNRDQLTELRNLRQSQKATKILEEEKRALQLRLGKLDDLEKELDEANYQRQLLESERQSWASYLQSEGSGHQRPEFDSPETFARALRNERIENASLTERLGAAEPLILEKDGLIRTLEEDKARLQVELSNLKSGGATTNTGPGRIQARLERQRTLANKEIEYLREQLRTFDAEDVTGEVRVDAKVEAQSRVSQLESLITKYRQELDVVNTQLNSTEVSIPMPSLKRPPPDTENEAVAAQVSELRRKLRKLQQELVASQNAQETLASDNSALQTQLTAVQTSARTRILSLRNNPTDGFEARKMSNISLLRRENEALRAQLDGRSGSRKKDEVVPMESLEEAQLQIEDAMAQVRSKEKHHERLKQVFAAKSQEMREAIASLLGWNVEFMPNGKFRLTSIFADERSEQGSEEIERHITFSSDGMMAIAGGPNGNFAREMASLIRFWVEERNEIPGFLAAMTLENLDRAQSSRSEDDM